MGSSPASPVRIAEEVVSATSGGVGRSFTTARVVATGCGCHDPASQFSLENVVVKILNRSMFPFLYCNLYKRG